MRFPQVSDRVKEAPAQALRGVFAGIGQLLLFTDKLRNKTPASQQVPRARVPQSSETAPDAATEAPDGAPRKTPRRATWEGGVTVVSSARAGPGPKHPPG